MGPVAVATNILRRTTSISAARSHNTGVVTIFEISRQKGDILDVFVTNPSACTVALNAAVISASVAGIPLSFSTFSKSTSGFSVIVNLCTDRAEIVGFRRDIQPRKGFFGDHYGSWDQTFVAFHQ